jgi:hypothetical protein
VGKDKKKKKDGKHTKLLVAVFIVIIVALGIRFYVKYDMMPWNHFSEFLQIWKWVL